MSRGTREGMIGPIEGQLLIDVVHPAGTGRPEARRSIRSAVQQAAAMLLDVARERVCLSAVPGTRPCLFLDGLACALYVSISHAERLSVAALGSDAPLGIDLMAHEQVADWRAVTADYLGPLVLAELEATVPAQRMAALARAWCAREAALKALGLPLQEWTGAALPCRIVELDFWPGHAACLAMAPVLQSPVRSY
ncbi:MAG: 4'-phosphopantetheinyl transferase superfamily protein [Herminiimonas sp.]|nr:4'-phosphopantetheinyl transferase superfamily protein [Herminiimonas sp.]